jgi:hypothetical protein
MTPKMRLIARVASDYMRQYSFLIICLMIIILAQPLTACAGIPQGVTSITLNQYVLDAAQRSGDLTLYLKPGVDCSLCWISFAQDGGRVYALAQAERDGMTVLPVARQAIGPASIESIEASLRAGGWSNAGRLIPLALGIATRNPGLIMLTVGEFDPGQMGWETFKKMAYPTVAQ